MRRIATRPSADEAIRQAARVDGGKHPAWLAQVAEQAERQLMD
jgi:hypothetical protein